METPTDEALLQRIALADEGALVLLYDRYGRSAYSLAYRIVGNFHDAEDVVQDAFLNVWRMASSFNIRRGTARSWLLSVVHHRAIDVIRGRRILSSTNSHQDIGQLLFEVGEIWQSVAQKLDRQAIEKALSKIPGEQRKVIELAYFGGYTHREIAKHMKTPLGTVKERIRMGMEKLRGLLKDLESGVRNVEP